MLFNKVLGESEKCVYYFYLKIKGTFWPTQYNGILLSHKKEQNFALCCNMDGLRGHYAK